MAAFDCETHVHIDILIATKKIAAVKRKIPLNNVEAFIILCGLDFS